MASASTAKTRIGEDVVLQFLRDRIDPAIASVDPLTGGENAQAFAFRSGGLSWVIRVDRRDHGFRKDAYAARRFGSTRLPIPGVRSIEPFSDQLFACISERAEGIHLGRLKRDAALAVMPRVLALFDALEEAPLEDARFGPFDENGAGRFSSWREAMLAFENSPDFPWAEWYRTTCLESDLCAELIGRLKREVTCLPEQRRLVHGDIGMDNVLTDGDRLTAVLDWGQARYGDPVFDVAWLNLWWVQVPFAGIYAEQARRVGRDLGGLEGRLRWYTDWIGLTSLAFYARTGQPASYRWLKDRLQSLAIR
jgi:hygromycin-B 4-O-kinase